MAYTSSATSSLALIAVLLLVLLQGTSIIKDVHASDAELTTDFLVPEGVNASTLDGSFFTFTGFRGGPKAPNGTFKPLTAFAEAFPALGGLGISAALLEYQPGTQNAPHTHPRATELFYVIQGTVMVGLVDTSGSFYNQTLETGDLFVFPKGLVHFQVNPSSYGKPALAIAAFSSSNPGTVSLPITLFGSGIPLQVLVQAFYVNSSVITELELPFIFNNWWIHL